jgi:nucleotide-binding universal stress UspA family protein
MKVLLAVDGSPYSDDAVAIVIARPWPKGTVVRVLSAMRVISVLPPVGDFIGVQGQVEVPGTREAQQEAQRLVGAVAEKLKLAGIDAQTAVKEGDPRNAIVDEAQEWSADLIVVGSHGLTGIARWLLGSVAQSVVAHAPCSVEVVRRKTVPA